jgi:hypothetical protein
VEDFSTTRPDPAEVAAKLRGYIARHDAERQLNQRAIRLLIARNCFLGHVVGRLRRDAQQLEHNADLVRRQRRAVRLTKTETWREAA